MSLHVCVECGERFQQRATEHDILAGQARQHHFDADPSRSNCRIFGDEMHRRTCHMHIQSSGGRISESKSLPLAS
jgi:hypothetical protein